MVIERFKPGCVGAIAERFEQHGRLLPEGLRYLDSWIDPAGERCFQLMEGPSLECCLEWARQWEDLVSFEITPVVSSREYWSPTR